MMEETSAFFGSYEELSDGGSGDIQIIHESPESYSILSRATFDGKLVALKSLKPEYVGNPFMRVISARSTRSAALWTIRTSARPLIS